MTNDVAEVKSADEFENEKEVVEERKENTAKLDKQESSVVMDDEELAEEVVEKDLAKDDKFQEVSGDLAATTADRKDAENEYRAEVITDNATEVFDVTTTGTISNGNATLDVNKAVPVPSSAPVMIAEVEEEQADFEYAPEEETIEDARFANDLEQSAQPTDDRAAMDSVGYNDLYSEDADIAVADEPQLAEVVVIESKRVASVSRAFKEKKAQEVRDKNLVSNSSNLAEHTALLGVLNAGW